MAMMRRLGNWCKQLQDDIKGKIRYWKLKEEAVYHTVWRTHFDRACGPVVRQKAR
jgi:hypothetical protein